jgi:hypothetical protein
MKNKTIQKQTYTIDEFCEAYSICRATFYKLQIQGRAPKLKVINRKHIIKIEDAKQWFEDLKNGK